jgi:Fe-S-cluster containining protein
MPEIQFEIKVREHNLKATVQLPDQELRPVDLLPILQGFSNAVVGAASEGMPVSCKAGCGACCRQVVPISETEAIFLKQLISEMPEDRRAVIRERFAQAVERLKEAGLYEELDRQAMLDVDRRKKLADRYFQLSIACPFLEEESCSIHEQRPLACREYLVVSDPRHCAAPRRGLIQMVTMPKALSYILYRFGDGVGNDTVKFLTLTRLMEYEPAVQPMLPAAQMFENFFRAVTAPAG